MERAAAEAEPERSGKGRLCNDSERVLKTKSREETAETGMVSGNGDTLPIGFVASAAPDTLLPAGDSAEGQPAADPVLAAELIARLLTEAHMGELLAWEVSYAVAVADALAFNTAVAIVVLAGVPYGLYARTLAALHVNTSVRHLVLDVTASAARADADLLAMLASNVGIESMSVRQRGRRWTLSRAALLGESPPTTPQRKDSDSRPDGDSSESGGDISRPDELVVRVLRARGLSAMARGSDGVYVVLGLGSVAARTETSPADPSPVWQAVSRVALTPEINLDTEFLHVIVFASRQGDDDLELGWAAIPMASVWPQVLVKEWEGWVDLVDGSGGAVRIGLSGVMGTQAPEEALDGATSLRAMHAALWKAYMFPKLKERRVTGCSARSRPSRVRRAVASTPGDVLCLADDPELQPQFYKRERAEAVKPVPGPASALTSLQTAYGSDAVAASMGVTEDMVYFRAMLDAAFGKPSSEVAAPSVRTARRLPKVPPVAAAVAVIEPAGVGNELGAPSQEPVVPRPPAARPPGGRSRRTGRLRIKPGYRWRHGEQLDPLRLEGSEAPSVGRRTTQVTSRAPGIDTSRVTEASLSQIPDAVRLQRQLKRRRRVRRVRKKKTTKKKNKKSKTKSSSSSKAKPIIRRESLLSPPSEGHGAGSGSSAGLHSFVASRYHDDERSGASSCRGGSTAGASGSGSALDGRADNAEPADLHPLAGRFSGFRRSVEERRRELAESRRQYQEKWARQAPQLGQSSSNLALVAKADVDADADARAVGSGVLSRPASWMEVAQRNAGRGLGSDLSVVSESGSESGERSGTVWRSDIDSHAAEDEPQADVWRANEAEAEPQADVWRADKVEAEPQADVWRADEAEAEPQADVWRADEAETESQADVWRAGEAETEPQADVWRADEAEAEPQADVWRTDKVEAEPQADVWRADEAETEPQADVWQADKAEAEPHADVWQADKAEAEPQADVWRADEAETEPQADVWQADKAEAEPHADVWRADEAEVEAKVEAEPQADVWRADEAETEPQADVWRADEAETEPQADVWQADKVEAEPQADVRRADEAEVEAKVEAEPQADVRRADEAEVEAKVEAEPQADVRRADEAEVEAKVETEPQADVWQADEAETEPQADVWQANKAEVKSPAKVQAESKQEAEARQADAESQAMSDQIVSSGTSSSDPMLAGSATLGYQMSFVSSACSASAAHIEDEVSSSSSSSSSAMSALNIAFKGASAIPLRFCSRRAVTVVRLGELVTATAEAVIDASGTCAWEESLNIPLALACPGPADMLVRLVCADANDEVEELGFGVLGLSQLVLEPPPSNEITFAFESGVHLGLHIDVTL
ncbi:glycoprotein [Thecamonas trahens ATCC 50062]|uniref:Glycoprotein n=1 Tax=Thecamonas trahens ATCC 50062 TaxID=461836 RepID=A0A0L0D476_THETB|nr:glycoprotein [Thecamonas trahens ATCC 50062]KNC47055.1 glycoprotein [Thecamonas trahens ATCC 50062]|eukprot:XP_013759834.1 glycoprotein [Thecamonas trahens ATCC 50062]